MIATGDGPADNAIAGNGIRVVSLKYVSATEVARVLEPMVPKGAIVQADDARNILALKGSPTEIESMLDSISVFDVDVMKGMSFAVVPVKTPQPEKMVDELKAIFAAEKEGPLKGRVRFIANTAAWRHSGRDLAAELFAKSADLDQAARCQGGRLRAAASRLSGAEPARGGARKRAAVDVCERDESGEAADTQRLATIEAGKLLRKLGQIARTRRRDAGYRSGRLGRASRRCQSR